MRPRVMFDSVGTKTLHGILFRGLYGRFRFGGGGRIFPDVSKRHSFNLGVCGGSFSGRVSFSSV